MTRVYNVYECQSESNWVAPKPVVFSGKEIPILPPVVKRTFLGQVSGDSYANACRVAKRNYPDKRLSIRRD